MKPQNRACPQNIDIQVLHDFINVNNRGFDSKKNDYDIQFPNIFVSSYMSYYFFSLLS